MTTIRVDTYPTYLNSVEVRDADTPATLLETIVVADIAEVADGVYQLTSVLTTGNWLLILLDSNGESLGVKYANPSYLQATDYPPWLNAVDLSDIEGSGYNPATDSLVEIKSALDTLTGGSGSETYIINVVDTSGEPLANVNGYVTSDIAGSSIVLDNLVSNTEGKMSLRLDPGTYYLWLDHPNYTETNPTEITVTVS